MPILIPLAVGASAVVGTILLHGLAVSATVNLFRYEQRSRRAGVTFGTDVAIAAVVMLVLLAAHLIEVAVWAVLFIVCGEFADFGTAYYHSAVNYTTLGYGDLIMSPAWRLLGPLEAANGMLMFGVSTAILFAVIQRVILARFADVRSAPRP
jgi:hypothetical protein